MKRISILFSFLFLIAAGSYNTVKAQAVNVNDSLALVDFYNSTGGPDWHHNYNWLTTAPVITWYGVFMNNTGKRVNMLYMNSNHLHGPIPASIGNLTALTTILLYHNQLNGAIPSSIGNLVNLTEIRLDENNLSGAIPAGIGNLTKLTELILNDNKIQGTIPTAIGNLVNMKELDLYNNQIHGSIPSSLGNLTRVQILRLDNNQLHGKIPGTLGNLSKVFDLSLNNNYLGGTIPNSFHKLINLYTLNLSYNRLSQYGNDSFPISRKYISFYINNNRYTFDGIEPSVPKFSDFMYAPQTTIIPVYQNGNILSVYAGGTLSNNTYKWSKVGSANSTTITGDSTFHPAASGMYYVTVTNAIATQLTLYSDTINFVKSSAKQSNIIIAKAAQSSTIISHMQIYPNPARDIIHIQTNGTDNIILTNSNGKVLLTKNINNTDVIDVSKYANGVYYLQNKTSGEVQKIVVVH